MPDLHLHICSICLRLVVSSLTEIRYLQIESRKREQTNESMMIKIFYLYGFFKWAMSIWWAIEYFLLVYKLFEFVVELIPAMRNKAKIIRSSRPEVFLGKGILKICSKFTGEQPCRSVISIKLQSNFTEITLGIVALL